MRPDIDSYFIEMAKLVARRSTCVRRSVGCVLVDRHHHVIATGYNGVPAGMRHCNDVSTFDGAIVFANACDGANAPSGTNLDSCLATHAEQNAILQCSDAHAIVRAYVTAFPCTSCAKLLINTGCREIVYIEPYADGGGMNLWIAAGRLARQFDGEPPMIQRDIVRLFGEGDPLNEWRVVVACVCLNLAPATTGRGIIMRILAKWPRPELMANAGENLEELLRPLGLSKRRGASLRCIGACWGDRPLESLPGVGPYAIESVRVFCRGELPMGIGDRKVAAWADWRRRKK